MCVCVHVCRVPLTSCQGAFVEVIFSPSLLLEGASTKARVDCTTVLYTPGRLAFEFLGKSLIFLLPDHREAVIIDSQHCICQLQGL